MVSTGKIYTIAELAQVHDGSLGTMYSYIDILSEIGVSAVKFQVHIAEAESSSFEPFRVKFSFQDDTRYDYWRRMEFTKEQWRLLFTHTKAKGMDVVVSVFSVAAFNLVKDLEIDRWKIASGEVSNLLLLDKIQMDYRPVIMSSGLSNFHELEIACRRFEPNRGKLSILHCVSKYPTPVDESGIHLLNEISQKFPSVKFGLSDHSGRISTCLYSLFYGAEILEFHVVVDRRMFGPDSKASLEFEEVSQLISIIRDWEIIKDSMNKSKEDLVNEDIKPLFNKSLAVNKALHSGSVISLEDLESKKPGGYGIPANEYDLILGRKLKRDLTKWEFLNYEDLL